MAKADDNHEAQDPVDELLKMVGLRLREARLRTKLTQKEIGETAGHNQSQIFQLESGKTNLTLRTLWTMADLYGVHMRDFFPEGDASAASTGTIEMLSAVLDKAVAVLREHESQDIKRQVQYEALLAELKTFESLHASLEREAIAAKEAPAKKAPTGTATRRKPARPRQH